MKLLLNGCSYGAMWNHFPGMNLSQFGGSFYRSVRTTVEYCATYGNPDAVLIPITFIDRNEYVTQVENDIEIEGPYNKSNTQEDLKDLNIAFHMLHTDDFASHDKFFLELAMFSGWLDSQNIPYLIWNQCNGWKHFENTYHEWNAINKLKYIVENKRIINLFEFCANSYMYEQGALLSDTSTNVPEHTHYSNEDYEKFLVPFLQEYIQENNLGISGLDVKLTDEEKAAKAIDIETPNKHSWLDS